MSKLLILVLFIPFAFFAQESKLNKGLEKFNQFAYSDAISLFEHYLKKGGDSSIVAPKIATSYAKINDIQKALNWYEFMFIRNYLSGDQFMEYALFQRQLKQYEKSITILQQYEDKFGANDVSRNLIEQNESIIEQLSQTNNFIIRKEAINSDASEIGVVFVTDSTMLVTSAKRFDLYKDKPYSWNNTNFYSICSATLNTENGMNDYAPLKGDVNTQYHDGPACIDTVNKRIYFTRDDFLEGKLGSDNEKTTHLKIYVGKLVNDFVSEIKELSFNSASYSCGHPTINQDGTKMYFVSDMPGGFGGTDLYEVDIDANGNVGQPVNLGAKVNSSLNEMFPFYHSIDNILFFSSNGLPGFGGLDVFYAKLSKDNSVVSVVNIGSGINGSTDDFSFITSKNQTHGFFCSNRNVKVGDDDIYSFKQLNKIKNTPLISGYILNELTGKPLPNSDVYLVVQNDTLRRVLADEKGFFEMPLDSVSSDFSLMSTPQEFTPKSKLVQFEENKLIYREDILFKNANYHRLIGVVKDRDTKKPIDGVTIAVSGKNKTTYTSDFVSDANGRFRSEKIEDLVPKDQFTVELRVSKSGYLTEKYVFSHLITTDSIIDVTAFLNLQMTRIEIGKTDLANVVQINPIYFDFDKFDIRPDAALELDKIVRVMLDNPDIKIELGSHTDTRGSDAYNLWLSDMRAKSSAEYIISNGISNDRIYGKGYGETKLIVTDATIGKKKAKADRERLHQLNRRTEFIIVGVGNSDSRTVEDNRITSKTTITQEIAYSDNQMVVVDYYVVKPNETLYRVFINTGVSVEKLKELNGLKNNNLKAGQKLRLN